MSNMAMPLTSASTVTEENITTPNKELSMSRQSTSHLLLIEPEVFYANPETMDTNVYQIDQQESQDATYQKALGEFRRFRDMLVENGVVITTLRGDKGCPDHLFPNWISTHEDRKMVIYPMLNSNRRAERSDEIIKFFGQHYDVALDISGYENQAQYLESTGSLNMDRVNKVVYSGLSSRTDEELARLWADEMGYEIEIFETRTHAGKPVYHTDLVMFIGTKLAAICADCIIPEHRKRIVDRLSETHDVVLLTLEQLQSFCGNSLEVLDKNGEPMLVMSENAYNALRDDQIKIYKKYFTKLLHTDISTIEKYGGGSARCLIMEMF